MFDHIFRGNTNPLQDDLRRTMKTYNDDKQRLMAEFSNLRGSERSSTSMSFDSSDRWSNDTDLLSRKSTYFRAPNIAATNNARREPLLPSTDKKWKEKRDTDRIKKEKEMLKLPVIHSANSTRTDWESGRNLSSKRESLHQIEPLPGISAAKALLEDSMKIPSIYDPQRSDKTLESLKSRNSRKKVTFADEKREPLLSFSEIEPNSSHLNSREPKNCERDKTLVPTIVVSKNHFQPMLRPRRPRKTTLPPLNLSLAEVHKNPQRVTEGVNQWKSLYGNMTDLEERTKALADIMYAVRVKKFENEQAMKNENSPRPGSERSTRRELYFLQNSAQKIQYRDENGQKKQGAIPKHLTPRGGMRYNSLQLQNYLRHMSKQRKIMEEIAAEKYRRMTTIAVNKSLTEMAPSETSVQA